MYFSVHCRWNLPYNFIKTVITVYCSVFPCIGPCTSMQQQLWRPSPVRTAISCPPSLLSQGHRYLWGMSSIQVTVPIVFWGRRPPSHAHLQAWQQVWHHLATGAGLARYVYGTSTRGTLSGDLIFQVLKFKMLSHLLSSNRLASALYMFSKKVTLERSPACCICIICIQH